MLSRFDGFTLADVASFDQVQKDAYRDWYLEQFGITLPYFKGICMPGRDVAAIQFCPISGPFHYRWYIASTNAANFQMTHQMMSMAPSHTQLGSLQLFDPTQVTTRRLILWAWSHIRRLVIEFAGVNDQPFAMWQRLAQLLLLIADAADVFRLRLINHGGRTPPDRFVDRINDFANLSMTPVRYLTGDHFDLMDHDYPVWDTMESLLNRRVPLSQTTYGPALRQVLVNHQTQSQHNGSAKLVRSE